MPPSPTDDAESSLTGPPAPEVSDEVMDLELATFRGGQHRPVRSGRLGYALLLLTPLVLAIVVAAVSALPPAGGTPAQAGRDPGRVPLVPVPQPADPTPTGTGTGGGTPTGTPGQPGNAPSVPPVGAPGAVDQPVGGQPGATAGPTAVVPQPVAFLSLEAETAEIGNLLTTLSLSIASGGEVVVGLGLNKPRSLVFPTVTVPSDGTYQVRIWCTSLLGGQVGVSTSAGTSGSAQCPATALLRMAAITINVTLRAGTNEIDLSSTALVGPLIDRITVSS